MSNMENRPRLVSEPEASDDSVARLLQLAGHRPGVPAGDAAIVKEAALAQWQQVVRAQRFRRVSYFGGGLLAAAAALLLVVFSPGIQDRIWRDAAEPIATAETIAGNVQATREGNGSGVAGLQMGDELVAGAVVETAAGGATPARTALRMADGSSLRLDAGTRLRLIASNLLELERGAVYVDSPPGNGPLEIRTSLGLAYDIGTQFEVRLEPDVSSLWVRVREGKVVLERDGRSHEADPGVELAVLEDGAVERGEVPLHGSSWEWAQAILPVFEVKGRPLQEFLTWAAREGGWTVRYSEEAFAAMNETVESGDISGLGLEDALTLVLTGYGLEHRLEDGVLTLEPSS